MPAPAQDQKSYAQLDAENRAFAQWLENKILQDKKATEQDSAWIEKQLLDFIQIQQLLSVIGKGDFDQTLAANHLRGKALGELVRAFASDVAQQQITPPAQLTALDSQISDMLAAIDKEDKAVGSLHAAAVETVAEKLQRDGFVPAIDVPGLGIKAHTMSVADATRAMRAFNLLDDHPRPYQGQLRYVKPPIEMTSEKERFKQDIMNVAAKLNGNALGLDSSAPTTATVSYLLHNNSGHFVRLRATVNSKQEVQVSIKDSRPKKPTTDTATHRAFEATCAAVEELKSHGIKLDAASSHIECTGKQHNDDAIICGYLGMQDIASHVETKEVELVQARSPGELKRTIDQRLAPTIPLVVDPETQTVRAQTLTPAQEDKFAKYKAKVKEIKLDTVAIIADDIASNQKELDANKVPEFSFSAAAFKLAEVKEEVEKLTDSKAERVKVTQKVSDCIDTLFAQSKKATELTRQAHSLSIMPTETKLTQSEQQAYADLQDASTKAAAKETLRKMHQTRLLSASLFASPAPVQTDDEKLARILQNEFEQEYLNKLKTNAQQEAESLKLARELEQQEHRDRRPARSDASECASGA